MSTFMLKFARKHPVLCACLVVAVASLAVMIFYATQNYLAVFAVLPFVAVFRLAIVILNYRVFGGSPNSTIYRPGANSDDDPR